MEKLLEHGADFDATDDNGMAAIHFASEEGYDKIVKILLEKGCQVNSKNIDDETPLHLAVYKESLPIVALLLHEGADVNLRDSDGKTALEIAIELKKDSLEITRLIAKKACPNPKITDSIYPLKHFL